MAKIDKTIGSFIMGLYTGIKYFPLMVKNVLETYNHCISLATAPTTGPHLGSRLTRNWGFHS